jgi:hypothetical protein
VNLDSDKQFMELFNNMKNSSKFELVYKDKSIRQDGDFICLTDLWNASGETKWQT